MKKTQLARPKVNEKASLVSVRSYRNWILDLRKRYKAMQCKAAVAVNSAMLEFYWGLGRDISEKYPGKRRNVAFFAKLSQDLVRDIGKGLMELDSRKVRVVSQLIFQVSSSIQSDKVYDLIYRPWIASEKKATAQEMREWFFDFCYSLRNVMFHRVIDPFDRRWSGVMKNSFQGLREFLLENIKFIEDVEK